MNRAIINRETINRALIDGAAINRGSINRGSNPSPHHSGLDGLDSRGSKGSKDSNTLELSNPLLWVDGLGSRVAHHALHRWALYMGLYI